MGRKNGQNLVTGPTSDRSVGVYTLDVQVKPCADSNCSSKPSFTVLGVCMMCFTKNFCIFSAYCWLEFVGSSVLLTGEKPSFRPKLMGA